jgi:hypothetical protein
MAEGPPTADTAVRGPAITRQGDTNAGGVITLTLARRLGWAHDAPDSGKPNSSSADPDQRAPVVCEPLRADLSNQR